MLTQRDIDDYLDLMEDNESEVLDYTVKQILNDLPSYQEPKQLNLFED